MTSKTDIVKPKTVRVFDLDDFEKLLRGIKVAACMITESHQIVDEQSVIKRLNALTLNGASDGNCCSCCGVGPFETRAQQTAHYKHHWHTHNLKRKLFGKSALSLGQFNSRQDDNSSVSGSDSETESTNSKPASDLFAAATRHCKAFFTNKTGQVFCIYRCILHHKKVSKLDVLCC
ncbi:ankyrin repeat and zinc finger domain-containing protein 1-like [Colias croceus]|uniref:ankyrin repeat and zinc finger domain-containing protein 1-like n=1 Tax=Colias crocea TaxID=72248 RepID=UPI001E280E72|nr:ankyrin repeat and zinc finger domain-containing protein 1-like [Colias croceus]